ncbi:uncharacterized protein BO66DRAFT_152695 [Aspergillus aculeatinus CBS 121060]|uniref:Uncharacterized protein n=1 Tax=Aspergillus aculeatinus CBS 121060 TaxID=1448322 RepID=A0ACD1H1S9_9EURO|nr:hypothetical protein BO66DRAFT_152695 [Aspergillus aculeatinus CBS 121060]RAH67508.1 hypothetical protein BO66DRAFT_152695 [Aspergillus aculeatinus CBS 121060]
MIRSIMMNTEKGFQSVDFSAKLLAYIYICVVVCAHLVEVYTKSKGNPSQKRSSCLLFQSSSSSSTFLISLHGFMSWDLVSLLDGLLCGLPLPPPPLELG